MTVAPDPCRHHRGARQTEMPPQPTPRQNRKGLRRHILTVQIVPLRCPGWRAVMPIFAHAIERRLSPGLRSPEATRV